MEQQIKALPALSGYHAARAVEASARRSDALASALARGLDGQLASSVAVSAS